MKWQFLQGAEPAEREKARGTKVPRVKIKEICSIFQSVSSNLLAGEGGLAEHSEAAKLFRKIPDS